MSRYLFTVAYEGNSFSGWQIQKDAPSIQEALEKALAIITGEAVRIHGSGRTDAGVHALGQTFHADLPDSLQIPDENWPQAFNTRLPYSIRVLSAREVASDFHARFSAIGKTYVYRLATNRILMPFDFGRTGHYPHPIDGEMFRKAIASFAGTHDFHAFAAVRGNEPENPPTDYYIRTLYEASAETLPDGYLVRFTGTGFLYKMVRLMTGTAHAVASGKISWEEFAMLINSPDGRKARHCIAPYGLTLKSVQYPTG